ncbi:MAG: PorP/SprF family type IX secretion system membrane protein [Cytophagales bacterium]|nr:PorP/SprF family type IX secretion system membrane protein [Cytophagales bacterium]MDW8384682.1 PorP/SprF family type IX secretion system membrane protein [Flammeovirgaceae bacterium]
MLNCIVFLKWRRKFCLGLNLVSFFAFAQQEAQLTQFVFHQHYFNVACAGISRAYSEAQFIHRMQYLGYTTTLDANLPPTTQIFSVTSPFTAYNIGVGGLFANDRFGPLTKQKALFSLAYQFKIRNENILAVGAGLGAFSFALNNDLLRFVDPHDRYASYAGVQTQTKPLYRMGAFYQTSYFYTGVSVNQLLPTTFDLGTGNVYHSTNQHIYYIVGFHRMILPNFKISPAALVKFDRKVVSIEGGMVATYLEKLFLGLFWRESDAFSAIVGIYPLKSTQLQFSYAFDYVYHYQTAKAPTSHEILLAYKFGTVKPLVRTIIRTPRFRH